MRRSSRRRGVSLLEVLIAAFVLSVGLLGIAAMIPIGHHSLAEANKLDRSGQMGRRALREVKVRRMTDFQSWSPAPAGVSADSTTRQGVVIDPLGVSLGGNLAGVNGIPRISVANCDGETVFRSNDDYVTTPPDDPSAKPTSVGQAAGSFSWFCTVMPVSSESTLTWAQKSQFEVAVAVAFKRQFEAAGEQSSDVTFPTGGGYGGGSVTLASALEVKENEWVLLVAPGQVRWYRVAVAGESPTTFVALVGPDWNTNPATGGSATAKMIIVKGVVGVYSETVEMDMDPLWTQ